MSKMRIAINGFGRIGRQVLRQAIGNSNVEVVAINDPADKKVLTHLFKYDSVFGRFDGEVKLIDESVTKEDGGALLVIKNQMMPLIGIPLFGEREPLNLPWGKLGVDIVLECSGFFLTRDGAGKHLTAGAKQVIIGAPAKGAGIESFLMGVNADKFTVKPGSDIISMESCTTGCVAVMMKALLAKFKIVSALLTTTHSYTGTQQLTDAPSRSPDRSRAAALNMIPTTTGAAEAVTRVIPELAGKFNGISVRVPTPNVSLADVTINFEDVVTVDSINNALAAMAGDYLRMCEDEEVSSDIIGDTHACVVRPDLTMVIDDHMAKICAWYDNEFYYATNLVRLAQLVAKA